VCETPAVGPPRRRPLPPPRRPIAADYVGGGCLAIVTLALLIACPTKVYHYHRHPSWPAQRTESPRFALYILFSIPLPQASSSLFLHLSFLSFSLSFSRFYFSFFLFMHFPYPSPSAISDTVVSLAYVLERAPYYRAWKLSPALFELFATVLIRFIAAAATAGRDRRFGFSFTTQLSPGYTCRGREITRYPRRARIYIASNHSPTD